MASKKRFKQKQQEQKQASPRTTTPLLPRSPDAQGKKDPAPDLYKPPTTFSEFSAHCRKLVPFIVPRGKHATKFRLLIAACFGMLLAGRWINFMLPMQYKNVVDALGGVLSTAATDGAINVLIPDKIPYKNILMFVALRFLSGGGGLLSTAQAYLWIPVGQYTTREISVRMFAHLHNLSLRFHLNRKTGEILRVQDRGVASIVSIFSSIIFNILPTLADISIACFYFALKFDMYFGLIVFTTMGLYIFSTIYITEYRTKYRRISNALDNALEAKMIDSLLNVETVKYFSAEDFEVYQYKRAVKEYHKADFYSNMILSALNTVQNMIIQFGLLIGCILCAKRIIHDKTMTVGDFVLYLSYITQLYGPLNWFGNHYRVIQKNFVDMEKMLDLFKEPIEVKDPTEPTPLDVKAGEVVFDNVSFAYDLRRPVLENISFKAEAGSTIALVGPSGSGKSTVLRLLFRFYDVQEGSIRIDGVDIRDLKQKDLRHMIGVVPQDTVLFNDTIKYNVMYGRPDATDEEVLAASESAQIHDRILTFPDAYETKVGERGLRLSGGEKQRVAIARTLLKNPSIILLDEATSALDTRAEAALQTSLLSKSRTTIVIAHRLSTIVNADQILVIKDGRCVERGTHESLMRMRDNGVYFDMWMKQLKDEMGLGGLARMESVGRWVADTTTAVAAEEPSEQDAEQDEQMPGESNGATPPETDGENGPFAAVTELGHHAEKAVTQDSSRNYEEEDNSSLTESALSLNTDAEPGTPWAQSGSFSSENSDDDELPLTAVQETDPHGPPAVTSAAMRRLVLDGESEEGSTRAVVGDDRTDADGEFEDDGVRPWL
ncbi:hypothetical protein DFJ77DRAFT_460401 [Powellomyces hirtus]|nr:hypothetical protein DFJ77DRAFT_460401 [Powellomyces hirtus]